MTPSLSIVLALGLAAASAKSAPAASASNPFFAPSPLPFQAPPFDRIKDSDYQPALEEGMRRRLAEVQRIADNPEPPTFANTIEAMERSGELLTRVSKVYNSMLQANTSEALQKVDAEEAPRIAAHQDEVSLNPKLFARIKAIY